MARIQDEAGQLCDEWLDNLPLREDVRVMCRVILLEVMSDEQKLYRPDGRHLRPFAGLTD